MPHSKAIMRKHMSLWYPLDMPCQAKFEDWRLLNASNETSQHGPSSTFLESLPSGDDHPSFVLRGLEESTAPPFYLITMFAPPFLAGYHHHRMKKRWCKSARCTVALTYPVAQSDYDNNVETTTYVNSKPHPLANMWAIHLPSCASTRAILAIVRKRTSYSLVCA